MDEMQNLADIPGSEGDSIARGQLFEIDAQLLALFIEMASLQAKRLRGLRDLPAVPLELGEHLGALECENPLRERPVCVIACAGNRPSLVF